jgi:hypothetical protein
VEYESADDFVLPTETKLMHAAFTGLLTGGATPSDISNVVVEIYRVFPKDSNVGRTSGPPVFSTENVPTRVNSPSDVAFESKNSASDELKFHTSVLDPHFTTEFSVSSADKISVKSRGNGPATGKEVLITVTFKDPFDLPADHYFFVPQVGLRNRAPAGSDFLWLSAPKPIQPPGTPFTPDLQSWMRDDPPLAPDWLRIGTDIIGGTTFNASFALSGETVGDGSTSVRADHDGPFTDDTAALVNRLLAGTKVDNDMPLGTIPTSDTPHGLFDSAPLVATEEHVHGIIPGSSASHPSRLNDLAFMEASDDFLPAFSQGGTDSPLGAPAPI